MGACANGFPKPALIDSALSWEWLFNTTQAVFLALAYNCTCTQSIKALSHYTYNSVSTLFEEVSEDQV